MHKILGVCTLALLSACAANYMWVKDGATQADFDRDRAQCLYEANLATASYSTGPTARGYGNAAAQGFGEGMAMAIRQGELGVLCMQARGYSKAPLAQ